MRLDQLFTDPSRREFGGMPEMDALTDDDALQEAELVEVHLDVMRSAVGFVFDLRNALQLRPGNTAVVVVRDLQRLEWSGLDPQGRGRVAHYVMSSRPEIQGDRFALTLDCLPNCQLTAVGLSAEFFVGDVPGLPEAPPNCVEDDDAVVSAGMPGWCSAFEPGWATFLDAALK